MRDAESARAWIYHRNWSGDTPCLPHKINIPDARGVCRSNNGGDREKKK
jgi:hypothetical protein